MGATKRCHQAVVDYTYYHMNDREGIVIQFCRPERGIMQSMDSLTQINFERQTMELVLLQPIPWCLGFSSMPISSLAYQISG